ncbi:MAG: O-antigen ligase family protein [Saprospiraceae bacterium]|nr:O-antigen ligase family protein [Saprospiraceae bacterium]
MLITIIIIIMRHEVDYGFEYSGVNFVMGPFYRNHVAYAAIMVVFAPFLYFLYKSERFNGKSGWVYLAAGILLILGIYLSFTRAAYFALIAAVGFAWIVKYKLTKLVYFSAIGAGCLLILFLIQKNRYLELAPNYERTISHNNFEDLINATYQFQDISTMERLYRWVAAFRMIEEKPLMGYGPGSFYTEYRSYTLRKFETYVSDNPEKSGIHNYYLMIAIDQGIPGLILFLAFIFVVLMMGERIYHAQKDPHKKVLALSAITSIFVILVLQLMNDLLETNKIGPFFFVSLAILIHLHLNSPVVVPKNNAA